MLPTLREQCASKCAPQTALYDKCVERIELKGEGDCEAWYFDKLHCVDKCVAPQAFKYTK